MVRFLSALTAAVLLLPAAATTAQESSVVPLLLRSDGHDDPWESVDAPSPTGIYGIGTGQRIRTFFPNPGGYGAGCTANFVWRDAAGSLYLGSAGHCFVRGGFTATHGPGADFDPTGTVVEALVQPCETCGSSWMRLGPPIYARNAGLGSDFGVVRIPEELHDIVRPDMPVWGGPDGERLPQTGDVALHFGYGVVYGQTPATRSRPGLILGASGDRWTMAGNASFGDSGSALNVVSSTGRIEAGGIITHSLAGLAGYAAGTTVPRAKEMAREAGLEISVLTTD